MSTKIYNGLRFKPPGGIFSIIAELERFRDAVILPMAREEMHKVMATMIAERSDQMLWDKRHDPDFELTPEVMEKIRREVDHAIRDRIKEMKAESRRDPAIDCEFILTFFEADGEILAIPRCEKKDFLDAFMQFPGIEKFGYWNNTDSLPDGVSKKEFEARGALWDKAFSDGSNEYYAPRGMTFTFISEGFRVYASLNNLARYMPTVPQRFREIQNLEEYRHIEPTLSEQQRGQISEWMHAARKWNSSLEGQAIIEKMRVEFEDLVASRGWVQKPTASHSI